MDYIPYPFATIGTAAVLFAAFIVHSIGHKVISSSTAEHSEQYRKRKFLNTATLLISVIAIGLLWIRLFQRSGTVFSIIAAGLAVALREPLLSVAGRVAIFAGHMYTVGDRIEINKMSGDVIDVGFFYTRMMEIGNWIHADQASGRIVQFSNSMIFGTPVFNYTQNFHYVWDEVKFVLTYDSNLKAANQILLEVGGDYTKEYLQGAQKDLEAMQRVFLVPKFEVEPQTYVKVTDNWVELTMRYVVAPKKRRSASSFIYKCAFPRLQDREDITLASETMDVTVHGPKGAKSARDDEQLAA